MSPTLSLISKGVRIATVAATFYEIPGQNGGVEYVFNASIKYDRFEKIVDHIEFDGGWIRRFKVPDEGPFVARQGDAYDIEYKIRLVFDE